MNFSDHVLEFLSSLDFSVKLPAGISVMNPYKDIATRNTCTSFYQKFYADTKKRRMIIGINPGRHGAGLTGIPFTDPIRLQQECGIQNDWDKKQELSSLYIYDMIKEFGTTKAFYQQFYIGSVSPLGFTRSNKNLNYYDDKLLEQRIRPFVISCFKKQIAFGLKTDLAFCLGDGKNYKFLLALNTDYGFFDKIIPLPHPRYIMQYKLKDKKIYIESYLTQLRNVFG